MGCCVKSSEKRKATAVYRKGIKLPLYIFEKFYHHFCRTLFYSLTLFDQFRGCCKTLFSTAPYYLYIRIDLTHRVRRDFSNYFFESFFASSFSKNSHRSYALCSQRLLKLFFESFFASSFSKNSHRSYALCSQRLLKLFF